MEWTKFRYNQFICYHPVRLPCPVCGCNRNEFQEAYVDEKGMNRKEIAIPMKCELGHTWELKLKRHEIPDDGEATCLCAEETKK
ncbi:MAG: hypothetical protein ABSC04_20620 [Syntrophobacteraceae bacterium]|jgi:hypothetical protein